MIKLKYKRANGDTRTVLVGATDIHQAQVLAKLSDTEYQRMVWWEGLSREVWFVEDERETDG